ncbi:hypothetical protein DN748_03905, partial [Sinomicrobium soli]
MILDRRNFIRNSSLGTGALLFPGSL